jgi:hypothetical protein
VRDAEPVVRSAGGDIIDLLEVALGCSGNRDIEMEACLPMLSTLKRSEAASNVRVRSARRRRVGVDKLGERAVGVVSRTQLTEELDA